MRTPEEIMKELDARVAQIQEQAGRAEEALAESATTLASEDEVVTVTVNAGGTLTGLRFSPQARGMSGTGLAELVLDTYNRAVEESGRKTAQIMSGLLGADSEAMGVLNSFTRPPKES
ncbi:YbaB/EbfC family nucleoid-associated protein [Glycomyces tritici]|uniref:YbaB/EbfC family nucleoid-associated protein n=1 Tax=Glycomyces tritici TaxID=2665176 RepID=A0ABT7YIL5_9ACTN|nr:YbaB/EbfC family nucleoid-associated protein [Glycomyces tritici]MDN3238279.1 YbaB/EbfC family nucleoid-associated protein [Glycomyces tritici]